MCAGHFQARLVYYLMNVHTQPRCIYLCRVQCITTRVHLHVHVHVYMIVYSHAMYSIHVCAFGAHEFLIERTDYCAMLISLLCSMVRACATCMAKLVEIHHFLTEEKRYMHIYNTYT